jgi:S-disulfanyl-L-cysteine oxidoreductase SoxD
VSAAAGIAVLATALATVTVAFAGVQDAAPAARSAPTAARSVWDGVFTEAQAARGQERYRTSCATCHAEDLLGANGPAVVGPEFLDRWNGTTVLDMVQTIRQSMPLEAPDSLGLPAYVDIVTFLLKSSGSPAGGAELSTDDTALRQVLVTSHGARR